MSDEFEEKMTKWGIKQLVSPPYHPANNGLTERAVGLVKDRLKKMDCSVAPIQLHIGLQSICRVHGLTPHRSTGRCPYELVKEGPVTSLFPRLTDSSSCRGEQTALTHSVDRLTKKATFAEGEEVIVYNLKSKISSKGKIVEVLGNNTYLADCGKGPQHISGDVISRISDVSRRQIGSSVGEHAHGGGLSNMVGRHSHSGGCSNMVGGHSHGGNHNIGGHGGHSHGGNHNIG